MEIIRQQAAARAAGEKLSDLIDGYGDTPILLLLSGGSALALLDYCAIPEDAAQLFIGVLDERFGERLADQNFAKVKDTKFYLAAAKQSASPLDLTETSCASSAALAAAFEESLRRWVQIYPEGKIIVTMGVGKDGHIAGLIPPLTTEEFGSMQWVIAHNVSAAVNAFAERVTVTRSFLLTHVDHAIVYVSGEDKRGVLDAVLTAERGEVDFPAGILKEMRAVELFTDIISIEEEILK